MQRNPHRQEQRLDAASVVLVLSGLLLFVAIVGGKERNAIEIRLPESGSDHAVEIAPEQPSR